VFAVLILCENMKTHYRAVCYQGYRSGQSLQQGNFPSREQVLEDLLILEKNFDAIRVYDSSKHTEDILAVIKEHNISLEVMLSMYMNAEERHKGVPEPGSDEAARFNKNISRNNELADKVIDIANMYPDIVCCISAGNEARSIWNYNVVSDKRIAELVQRIKQGVSIPVTYCEEWKSWVDDLPETSKVVDFLSIHIYPVWNHVKIGDAIERTIESYGKIQALYPDKKIVITEAGWPTQTDQKRIPLDEATVHNQTRYVSELMEWTKKVNTTVYIFEAFDEHWKGYSDPVDPEKNWGLYLDSRKKKV